MANITLVINYGQFYNNEYNYDHSYSVQLLNFLILVTLFYIY